MTGYAKNGDTQFFTWADDGNDYSTCEDCYGVYPGFYSLQHLFKDGPGHLTSSELFTSVTNPFSTGSGCPGGSNCVGTMGIISVRGSMYLQVSGRQLTSPVALTSCSWRAGAVTCTVPNSSPPIMTTGMYVTVRSANPSTYNFIGNLTGANSTSISYPAVSDPGPYAGSADRYFPHRLLHEYIQDKRSLGHGYRAGEQYRSERSGYAWTSRCYVVLHEFQWRQLFNQPGSVRRQGLRLHAVGGNGWMGLLHGIWGE